MQRRWRLAQDEKSRSFQILGNSSPFGWRAFRGKKAPLAHFHTCPKSRSTTHYQYRHDDDDHRDHKIMHDMILEGLCENTAIEITVMRVWGEA